MHCVTAKIFLALVVYVISNVFCISYDFVFSIILNAKFSIL